MKTNIKLLTNEKLIKDIEKFINDHKENIENVITQYKAAPAAGQLYTVTLEFHPIWIELEDENDLK